MLLKNYVFRDIHNLLISNNFKQIYKYKMPFRKTFEYVYEKKKELINSGEKEFIAQNLQKDLKKKNTEIISVSFEFFSKNYRSLISNTDVIINCTSNKNFVSNKYQSKNDHDLFIANKISKFNIKLILFSTRKVYRLKFNIEENYIKEPKCNYSKNKLISENAVKKIMKDKLLILRIVNIIGFPIFNKRKLHNTFIDIFFDKIKTGFIYDSRGIYKDFISIKKLSEIIFKLIQKTHTAYSMFQLVKRYI